MQLVADGSQARGRQDLNQDTGHRKFRGRMTVAVFMVCSLADTQCMVPLPITQQRHNSNWEATRQAAMLAETTLYPTAYPANPVKHPGSAIRHIGPRARTHVYASETLLVCSSGAFCYERIACNSRAVSRVSSRRNGSRNHTSAARGYSLCHPNFKHGLISITTVSSRPQREVQGRRGACR